MQLNECMGAVCEIKIKKKHFQLDFKVVPLNHILQKTTQTSCTDWGDMKSLFSVNVMMNKIAVWVSCVFFQLEVELLAEQRLQRSCHVIYLLCEWKWINWDILNAKSMRVQDASGESGKEACSLFKHWLDDRTQKHPIFMLLTLDCMIKPEKDRSYFKCFSIDQTVFLVFVWRWHFLLSSNFIVCFILKWVYT